MSASPGLCGPNCVKEIKNQKLALELGSSLFPQFSSFPDNFVADQRKTVFSEHRKYYLTKRFVFGSSAIAALRAKAASTAVPKPSRIESLTGFIVGRLMEGLKRKPAPPATVMVVHPVNIRRRTDPPLPESAFGNFAWFAVVFYLLSEEAELPDYVERLREVFDGIDGEDLRKLEPEIIVRTLSDSMGALNEIKAYKFSSWCNMGFYGLDFGWGLEPVWVAHMGDAGESRTKQQFLFMEGRNEGEIELWVLFGDEEIEMLENDHEFLAFATPNPAASV
ncbi:bahd acyltransferase at5g47980 [Phtheirospermum japonicum]|uniref:Bahd acyltransferase at5g47980 n=1 Tax=Phtheirospermum japonicum TaxID=374723 RepID=A0A830BWE6_9LAMI|nr:bahd acyltransferase at5g47980 [Phtheirospermum japonicum]